MKHIREWARFRAALVLTPVLVLGTGCVPFLADQQSARLLPAGEAEITPSFSYVLFSVDGDTEHVQDHYGIRAGYGVADGVELRGMYERVEVDGGDGVNEVGAGVKVALVPDQVALYLPVGFVTGEGIETSDTWTVAPTLLLTYRAAANVELTPSIKAIYPFSAPDPEMFLGFHLGAGLSSDLDVWAFRPEVGVVIDPGDDGTTWGFALGFSFRP